VSELTTQQLGLALRVVNDLSLTGKLTAV